jgi:hypothetical protein
MVTSLVLLDLAGGNAVDDLRILEKDEGFCRVLRRVESYWICRGERMTTELRWREERHRSVLSPSAVFRYLGRSHDEGEEDRRLAYPAFIPSAIQASAGLGKVNGDLVAFAQSRSPQTEATLDMDACLVETEKQEAL